jgi:hypothetical protein
MYIWDRWMLMAKCRCLGMMAWILPFCLPLLPRLFWKRKRRGIKKERVTGKLVLLFVAEKGKKKER